jgi:uncharacterized protein
MTASDSPPTTGALPGNLIQFVRLLRRAGFRCGAGATVDAVRAVEAVGIDYRDDVFWALHAVLVTRREEHEVFRTAFDLFWREPGREPPDLSGLVPAVPPSRAPGGRRTAERRLAPPKARVAAGARRQQSAEPDVDRIAWSDLEVSRTRDFEQMSTAELREAERAIAKLALGLPERRSRRWQHHPRGERVDLRRTLRAMLRAGHTAVPLQRSRRRRRALDLVLLCDISGSMEHYSRPLLHFAHALTRAGDNVHTFLFGTRVTNVTRQLRQRDVDEAMQGAGRATLDWSGGTRIGTSLGEFNRLWLRRVLAGGAVVLLITDGLDRDGARHIAREAARLRRSCRRLIWLNPLLRYEGFAPRAAGVRALLDQVHEMRPVHNLESMDQLVEVLASLKFR